MTLTQSNVCSHDGWSALAELWLGDVYPCSWYDHLDSQVRDVFYEITEKTQQDLDAIQRKIESFGVVVRRPVYENIEQYLLGSERDLLIKPQITPRDTFAVIGSRLLTPPADYHDLLPWQHVIDEYRSMGNTVDHRIHNKHFHLNGANIIRAGKDVFVDSVGIDSDFSSSADAAAEFKEVFGNEFAQNRMHFLTNGGHMDGCMAVLRPGVIICNRYFDDYARTFPDWQLFQCWSPEYSNHRRQPRSGSGAYGNNQWFLEDIKFPRAFNQYVIEHALDWVGDYTESFFEVNCLSIDENNVLFLGENETLFRDLEQIGITAHVVNFRCRTFWDSGLHCLTLDISRKGTCADYFPQRGDQTTWIY